jgi:mono/diheme cytochrome c family protein
MNWMRWALGLGLGLFLTPITQARMTPEQVRSLPDPAAGPISFGRDIRPILEASCIHCHGRGRAKGAFRLDDRSTMLQGGDSGPAVIAGRSQESLLIELVAGVDPDNVMPLKGKRLTPEEVGLLRAWIDQGAPWEADASLARRTPANLLPRTPDGTSFDQRPSNPIDRILKPYFREHQVKPGPPVDARTYTRRVYLDTIGLLPSPQEGAFVADDPYLRTLLVRRLLAEKDGFAEHWLSFWNDLLRNDYRGTGYIDGGRKSITPWLYAALSTNMPYDQFVGQLICPTPASEGFTKGIVWRGVVNASQAPPMQAAQNIAQVFMGVNLKCASCHDSFVDEWRLVDAYGLASIYADGPLEIFQCDKPTGMTAPVRFIYPELGTLNPAAPKRDRLWRLAEIVTGRQDGRLSRTIVNRLWARFFGRGLVEPLDDMEQAAWNQDLLDWLAEDLVTNRYNLKHTIELMLTSEAYQMPAANLGEQTGKDYVFRGPGIRRLSAEQFRDALGQLTGVWYRRSEAPAPAKEVRAGLVAADALAIALGRPNREQVVTCRASAATTLQALELQNGATLALVLESAAFRLTEAAPTPGGLLNHLYWQALGRSPTDAEKHLAEALLGQPVRKEGVEDLLWAMVMLPEFQLIY